MKSRRARKQSEEAELGGLRLVDEAVHLLRLAPPHTLAAYAIGTLPFTMGLLYFWMDMSYNTFAGAHCLSASLLLAVGFIWMKVWHVIFCDQLSAALTPQGSAAWTIKRLAKVTLQQAALQPTGFLAIPLALLILMPFGWAYAFYQNLSTLGGDQSMTIGTLVRRSWRQAGVWPRQNNLIIWLTCPWTLNLCMGLFFGTIWLMSEALPMGGLMLVMLVVYLMVLLQVLVTAGVLLCPFGFAVAGNVAMALMLAPYLLKTLFGVETTFNLSGVHSVFNTTFFAAVCALSYLCLDPIIKSCYVLRCFYGASRHNGADLLAELNRIRQTRLRRTGSAIAMIAACLFTLSPNAHADGTVPQLPSDAPGSRTLETTRLDETLDEVISQPEYSWRLPRSREEVERPAVLESFLKDFGAWSESFIKSAKTWIRRMMNIIEEHMERLLPERHALEPSEPHEWMAPKQILIFVLLVVVCSVLAITLYRALKHRRRAKTEAVAITETPAVDITDESVIASQLPSDEWLLLSLELLQKGEWRLAMRALHMAGLTHMAHADRITIERFKSNRDYLSEYNRRAHDDPNGIKAFADNIRTLERVWYGRHPVTLDTLEHFANHQQALLPPAFSARDWLASAGGTPST